MHCRLQDRKSGQLEGEKKMNFDEKKHILKFFSEYYKNAEINVPQVEQREIGVGIEKKIDARHMSFPDNLSLRNYLADNPPFYISYSASYYKFPSETPIEKKRRTGADLIFDLDLHSEGKYELYSRLEEIKQDAVRLVEDFLVPDFGLSKKEIFYVFSGNRGYHIHVRSKSVVGLGSQERREMVDYIRGVGLRFSEFFDDSSRRGALLGPSSKDGGYRGRMARRIIEILNEKPTSFYRNFKDNDLKNSFINGIETGNWSRIPVSVPVLKKKLMNIFDRLPLRSVDADAAVTYDISKLIRMPNTIHGGTGLVAKEIKDIDSFNPLNDAVAFSGESAIIQFHEDAGPLFLKGAEFSGKKGEKTEMPLYAGMFFVLKGSATFYKSNSS
ncbi:DNA primase catalytic subunit PriS [Candidatus Micrarchaeota archaeon]|nr:DNA primase catalytic subunit PriS [Candidatus Micrarchaeota archaeon]